MVLTVGIGGVTCGGKTTVTRQVAQTISDQSLGSTCIIDQDKYFHDVSKLKILPEINHWDFDVPEAINFDSLMKKYNSIDKTDIVLVDGNVIFESELLNSRFQLRFFFTLDYEDCKKRRDTRHYDPPDVPGYFEQCVWPRYKEHWQNAKRRSDIVFVDGLMTVENQVETIVSEIRKCLINDWVLLKTEPLDISVANDFVTTAKCGAISVFVGTTRDNFDSKQVIHLEYEAYEKMAVIELHKLCKSIREKHSDVHKIAIFHRLGVVPISQSSVIIAISSPHRKDAQEACQFAIDELKRSVPIFKKEIYADNSSEWKSNLECQWK